MPELRWTLLIIGVLFVVVLAWWERRKPHQASRQAPHISGEPRPIVTDDSSWAADPNNPNTRTPREPALTLPEIHTEVRTRDAFASRELPVVEIPEDSLVGLRADEDRLGEGVAERDIESFEESFAQDPPGHPTKSHATHPTNDPPGNKTRDFVGTPPRAPAPQPPMADEEPMPELPAVRSSPGDTVPELPALRPSPVDAVSDLPAVRSSAGGTVSELPTLQPSAGDPASEIPPPTITAGAKPIVEWPPEEQRTVVALRLVARPPERFRGNLVRQALAAEGFVLGELNIFHKPDAENHAVLSAASLTKPGTFDLETMDTQRFVGLNLFAVLPGPKSPQKAFDDLLTTARMLNERLEGALQDDRGGPLTPMRIQALRDALVSEAKL